MKKKITRTTSTIVIIIFASLMLCLSVFYLMNHVQGLLNSDVKINLTEIVTQNKDIIASRLQLETNNIKTMADTITDKMTDAKQTDETFLQSILHNLTTEKDDPYMAIADTDGNAVFRNGAHINIAARSYFKLAISGSQNISEKIISRLDGQDLYVICAPLYYNDKIIGTLQRGYTAAQMYELCAVSLFSDKGNMYIINSDGYVVFYSKENNKITELENYYRLLYLEGNEDASKQLEDDIQNNKSGFFESTNNTEKFFSAYTPITNIHDWYLITSVPINAVSPNGGVVVNMFYFILIFVVIIITSIALIFLWYKDKQQKALKKIAFVDTVTQGFTFNKFVIDVQSALTDHPNKNFYILKFDIDNFKYINNYFGFDFGDEILCEIQKLITKKLINHEILARIYSDQFVVFLEDAEESRIEALLKDIKNMNSQTTIYCSAGVYKITDYQESVNLMVDKARTAAQTVKGALDKKVAYYDDSFSQSTVHDEQLKHAIVEAIKNHEFVPFFQPKINIETHELMGSEALARWSVDGKVIPPNQFIPICERTGIIVDIDMMIFEKVLIFLKKNLDNGVECTPISVNFSRLHLTNPQFIQTIITKLNQYSIPSQFIEIELTESAFFDNLDTIYSFTNQLHEHGFKMAMDDFGSGYSSLNMLKDIPIDVLKVDREFLATHENQKRKEIIFASIVEMAHCLGIKVVVEGVETIDNINLMKKCNCLIAQGYYFSKPLSESDFEKIFKEKKI